MTTKNAMKQTEKYARYVSKGGIFVILPPPRRFPPVASPRV